MSLSGEFAVKQASMLDGLPFDASAFGEDGGAAAEVDIGGCEVVEAFTVSAMVVVIDKGCDLGLEVAGQVIVFEQDAVL